MQFRIVFATVTLVATCQAFVPPSPKCSLSFQLAGPKSLVTGSSSLYPLRMGMFDDMVASSDDKKRASENKSYLEGLQKRVVRINALEETVEELSDEQLQAKTLEFKARLAKGEDINGQILEEAFAVVREAAW